MLPLQYEQLVREYRRADLLQEASQQRLVDRVRAAGSVRTVRQTARAIVCRLPLPIVEPVCSAQPA